MPLTLLLVALSSCSPAGSAPEGATATNGAAWVSRTAPPAATPTPSQTTTSPASPHVVVIDPGHNGGNAAAPEEINRPVPDGNGATKPCNTVGTQTNSGYAEHSFNWAVAVTIRDLLVAQGVEVVLTRPDDAGVGPCVDERAALADEVGAVAFVSIHADGSAPGNRGFHVITSTLEPAGADIAAASEALAGAVRDSMSTVLPPSNYVGVAGLDARDDLAGLNLNLRPAIYLECGNLRDAMDAAFLSDPAGQAAIAAAVASAVRTFLGLTGSG